MDNTECHNFLGTVYPKEEGVLPIPFIRFWKTIDIICAILTLETDFYSWHIAI